MAVETGGLMGAAIRVARCSLRPGVAIFGLMAVVLMLGVPHANALPSFARQTGQQCAACHNGFPELTPYGRLFKLNGYTFGGGTSTAPPLAVMAIGSFTHTRTGQAGGAAPHFGSNDNFGFDAVSLFYGGEILPHLGAFAQVTYDGIGDALGWDNADLRYARTANLFGRETILGVSVNNNPSVSDVWNTTPAWGYPYQGSSLAPGAAGTMLEGGFGQQVVGSTAYAYWDRLLYVEAGGYATLSSSTQKALGAYDPGNNGIAGVAPYWRLALQREWGRNSLELGTFGMSANVYPTRVSTFGTDTLTDIGFDSQYQFLADRDSFSVQASIIFENQDLPASFAMGATSNTHDTLRSMHLKGTYFYNQTYGLTLGALRVEGTSDALLYGGSPNTTGLIAELNYIPFNHGGPSFWPWLNVKFGLQYIDYPEFNGQTGSAATANNTFYAYAWMAF